MELDDLLTFAIRSLDDDATLTAEEIATSREYLAHLEANVVHRNERAKYLMEAAIRSLDGKTVFPKEAKEAKELFVDLRALATSLKQRLRTEHMIRVSLLKSGFNEDNINKTIESTKNVPMHEIMRKGAIFQERMNAIGLDEKALRVEIITAVSTGDPSKIGEVMKKIQDAFEAKGETFR